jgi:hypothetical protein
LIADAASVDERGLASGDVLRQLATLRVDAKLTERTAEVLEHCDAARYGAWARPLDALYEEARVLLDDLAHALRDGKLIS